MSPTKLPLMACALLVTATMLAGCIDPQTNEQADRDPGSVVDDRALVHHRGEATVAASLPTPTMNHVPYDEEAFEPVIAATSDGSFFFIAPPKLWRTDDKGATWTDVSPAALGYGDPWLWVDPITDRLFAQDLLQVCTNIHWSDDRGDTWTTAPLGCGSTYIDHQKIATGVYPDTVPAPTGAIYPNIVYMGYNSWPVGKSLVSHSFDGGLTWPLTTQSNGFTDGCSGPLANGLHGALKTDSKGSLYVPLRERCGTGHVVAISRDAGLTFTHVQVGTDVGSTLYTRNPELAVDTEDNLYLVWTGPEERTYIASSRDAGATWSTSVLASPPNVTTTMSPTIVAGSAGRIAFSYYGLEDGGGEFPECVGDDARWNLYVTWSLDALSDDPTFATLRVNPLDDPINIGGIYTNSQSFPATCEPGLSMPHYFGIAVAPDGYVGVATTDACPPGCTTKPDGVTRQGLTAFQLAGPSLYAA